MKIFETGIRFFSVKEVVRGEKGFTEFLRGGALPVDGFTVDYDNGTVNSVWDFRPDAPAGEQIHALAARANQNAALASERYVFAPGDDESGITVSFVSDGGEAANFRGEAANEFAKNMRALFDRLGKPADFHQKIYPCEQAGAFAPASVITAGWWCPECGALGNTGKFCPNCGAKKPQDKE
jgi:hypothetical protein